MESNGSNDVRTSDPYVNDPEPNVSTHRMAVMYTLSLLYLCLAGCMLPHGGVIDPISVYVAQNSWMKGALWLTWMAIVAEAVAGVRTAPDGFKAAFKRLLLVCFIPPFRMTIASSVPHQSIWLPGLGWLRTGKEQLERLENRTALPMMLITGLIVPVIGAEMFFIDQVEQSFWLMVVVYALTALIWIAFVGEFILLVSVAERKVDYCKANWLNIVIILLPLIAFLRTLRLFRFLGVVNASKLMRAYRLRGLATRAMQLALLFNLLDRMMKRNPQKYRAHLEEKIRAKEEELENLKVKLQEVQAMVAESDHTS